MDYGWSTETSNHSTKTKYYNKKTVEYNGIQKELFTNVKSNKLESRNTL
jgi:hypothetical protein